MGIRKKKTEGTEVNSEEEQNAGPGNTTTECIQKASPTKEIEKERECIYSKLSNYSNYSIIIDHLYGPIIVPESREIKIVTEFLHKDCCLMGFIGK